MGCAVLAAQVIRVSHAGAHTRPTDSVGAFGARPSSLASALTVTLDRRR